LAGFREKRNRELREGRGNGKEEGSGKTAG